MGIEQVLEERKRRVVVTAIARGEGDGYVEQFGHTCGLDARTRRL